MKAVSVKLLRPLIFLALLAAAWFTACAALAVPAYPGPVSYRQPDGAEITLYLRGDEGFHGVVDRQSNVVMRDKNDVWVYLVNKNGVFTTG